MRRRSRFTRLNQAPWMLRLVLALALVQLGGVLVLHLRDLVAVTGWTRTACTVREAFVTPHVEHSGDWTPVVRYGWSAGGAPRTGETLNTFDDVRYVRQRDAEAHARRYPPGASVPCWVDPEDPQEATLERGYPMVLAGLAWPVVLVALGLRLTPLLGRRRDPWRTRQDGAEQHAWLRRPWRWLVVLAAVAAGAALATVPLGQLAARLTAVGMSPAPVTPLAAPLWALAGLALAEIAGHLLVPGVHLTVAPASPALGAPLAVRWHRFGLPVPVRVTLLAFEELDVDCWLSTQTDRKWERPRRAVFFRQTLPRQSGPTGRGEVALPRDAVATVPAAGHIVVRWVLRVQALRRAELTLAVGPAEAATAPPPAAPGGALPRAGSGMGGADA